MGVLIDLNPQIIDKLKTEFGVRPSGSGKHLREGRCPHCKKKSVWAFVENPFFIRCDHQSKCGWETTAKEWFPELYEQFNKKYPATKDDKNRTADAYLAVIRGFDTTKIAGFYEQANYWNPNGDVGTATVKFVIDTEKQLYWEKFIEPVTVTENGSSKKRVNRASGAYQGYWWKPPGMIIEAKDKIFITEGIFDAIALYLNGYKAVSVITSGGFPSESIKPYLGKEIVWVLALDNDEAGRNGLYKSAKRLREMGEKVGAALSSESESKKDWNDLHKQKKSKKVDGEIVNYLTETDMKHYRYLGRLELSENAWDKAQILYEQTKKTFSVYTQYNNTYSFKMDESKYRIALTEAEERDPGAELENKKMAFDAGVSIKEVATFKMDFLYFQEPENGEDGQFFFKLNFKNRSPERQLAFPGKVLMSHSDFKKAVANKTPSALFKGRGNDLDFLFENWMAHIPRFVKTLDYVGYHKDTQTYVFNDYAVERGSIVNLNKESFFELKKTGIKSTVDIKQKLNTVMKADWIADYQTAFGIGGMTALAWWFGCLFVEQVREKHRSYPFFEVVGEAGSGKSDMVDFLWKLLGKEGESFNPNSSTLAGRTRKMAEVSNLPVVFNETDNEKSLEERHGRFFNWDEQKDLFEGEFGRVTGIKSQDNSTRKPSFKAGLMIVQNIPVCASEAIMTRIIHLQFDRSHHSMAGKHASDRLNSLPVTDVSGFLLQSVQKNAKILEKFDTQFIKHKKTLQGCDDITLQRIIENHAKVMAFADCLAMMLSISEQTLLEIHQQLIEMAEVRQISLNEDHPVVQQFWSTYEYINSMSSPTGNSTVDDLANHSRHPDTEIAVNIESFYKRCYDLKVELPDTKELRRYLPSSRKRQFLRNDSINSRLENRTVRCYVFKR